MPQPDMSNWQGRDDTPNEGPDAVRWHQRVQDWNAAASPGHTLLGFACDEGVRRNQGRIGAATAPTTIRQALSPLAWHQQAHLYDAGDIVCADGNLEAAQVVLGQAVSDLIASHQKPIILGGGHETAWGTFLGFNSIYQKQRVGVINLDAHFDLRSSSQAHSGTPFAQMADWCAQHQHRFHYLCLGIAETANTQALFQRASKLGVQWMTDEELAFSKMEDVINRLEAFIQQINVLYLSIDLDVLPASVMRAVSAPASWGVPLERIIKLIEAIAQSGKLYIADMVEFNPRLDTDQTCVRVAARLLWHLTRSWILQP